jgi:hypothetical protein
MNSLASYFRPFVQSLGSHENDVQRNPMGRGTKIALGVGAASIVAVLLLNERSKSKCRERLAHLQGTYGTDDPEKLRLLVEASGGTMPDCGAFPLFREGI